MGGRVIIRGRTGHMQFSLIKSTQCLGTLKKSVLINYFVILTGRLVISSYNQL